MTDSDTGLGLTATNRQAVGRQYAMVLLGALLLYGVTCAPSLLWQDSGMIQYRVLQHDIKGGLGLALAHPLFYVLAIAAKAIPIGNVFHRINLVSAIAAAFAAANAFLLMRLWVGRFLPALLTALTLAVSHTFWRHACIVETYTLNMAFLFGELVCLLLFTRTQRPRWFVLLFLLNGLAISNHMLASIACVGYLCLTGLWLAKKQVRWQTVAWGAAAWLIGASLYLYLMGGELTAGTGLEATIKSALFGSSWQNAVLNTRMNAGIVKQNIMFLGLNFPTPNILLAISGFVVLARQARKETFALVLLILTCLYFAFASRYTVPDRYAFFLPFYGMVAILIGLGADGFGNKFPQKWLAIVVILLALLPVSVYAAVPSVAKNAGFTLGTKRTIPYRDDYQYFLQPWRTGYDGAERFAREALQQVEPKSLIFADGTTVYPLLCLQRTTGLRRDVTVVAGHGTANNIGDYGPEIIAARIVTTPVYVVTAQDRYCPAFLLNQYDAIPQGVLWRLRANETGRLGGDP